MKNENNAPALLGLDELDLTDLEVFEVSGSLGMPETGASSGSFLCCSSSSSSS